MNNEQNLYEEKIENKKRIIISIFSLLPLVLTVVVSITNFIVLAQKKWDLRSYFTLAGMILVGGSIAFIILYLILTRNKKTSIHFKNFYSIWISVMSSIISLILLIIEYVFYDNWYHNSFTKPGPRIYTLYNTSYSLNSIVLILFCINVFTTLWYIKKLSIKNK